MKHVIIGSGCIGQATGIWLSARNEKVTFFDISSKPLDKLEKKGYKVSMFPTKINVRKENPDIIWICTAEWDVEKVIKELHEYNSDKIYIIRSTMPVGETEKIASKYGLVHVAHIPEFLRQKTAINDIFNQDRIVIGLKDKKTRKALKELYKNEQVPVIFTKIKESEMIKYTANCWLAMQISYWNEIKKFCDKSKINPQLVADVATMDKRISKYGSAMIGEPYSGFCFPKDTKSLIKSFEKKKIKPKLLKAIVEVNDSLEGK